MLLTEMNAKQYECLVEGCGMKLKSYKSRQQHLVDRHKFPTSFEFFKRAPLSKKQREKIKRKQGCQKTEKEAKKSDMEVDNKVDDLVAGISKLSTADSCPSTVSFGRRHGRGLAFVPRAVQQRLPARNMEE